MFSALKASVILFSSSTSNKSSIMQVLSQLFSSISIVMQSNLALVHVVVRVVPLNTLSALITMPESTSIATAEWRIGPLLSCYLPPIQRLFNVLLGRMALVTLLWDCQRHPPAKQLIV